MNKKETFSESSAAIVEPTCQVSTFVWKNPQDEGTDGAARTPNLYIWMTRNYFLYKNISVTGTLCY